MNTPTNASATTRNPLKTAVFIDGAHLSRTIRNAFPGAVVAFEKLADLLVGSNELLRTYYYDALPYLAERPTEEEATRFKKAARFFHALEQLPRFTVREGRVVRRWDEDRRAYVYKQKSVDVCMSSDLVRLASKRDIDVAILVTGDADFVPAVEIAKEEGVKVRLLCSPELLRTGRHLLAAVDERIVLDDAMVKAARRAA
jgi:uncharacterized LabA/DUF88 family protein